MSKVNINIDLSEYILGLANQDAKMVLKFEDLPLIEEISQQKVIIENNETPFLENSIFGKGLRMRPKSTLSFPLLINNTSEFSFGFWLKSSWISPTVSPLTGGPAYYRMALCDKAIFTYANTKSFVNMSDGTFCVYEESIENNFNVLKIQLLDENGKVVSLKTSPYLTRVFHHFWISYYGPSKTLEVFIDGSPSNVFSEDGLPVPSRLKNSFNIPLHVNYSAVGYGSLLRNNSGLIDEFVFFNKSISDSFFLSRAINYGVEYIVDNSLKYTESLDYAFLFDDPTTVGIESILSNSKNIYIGRKDGALLRGERLMWQVKKDFLNDDEINILRKYIYSTDSLVSVENGFLKIYKASVRI